MKAYYSFFLLFSLFLNQLNAQEGEEQEHEDFKKWSISIATINSHVPTIEGRQNVIVPAWGLEFEYKLSHQWAIIGGFELEFLNYVVVNENDELLEREFPLIISMLIAREFNEHWIVAAGLGREIESNESFNLLIGALSYKIYLPENWAICPGVSFNTRLNGFKTYSMHIAFAKYF